MSHEIVKLIQVKDNQVWMRTESNNVTPKYYHKREQPYWTAFLVENGREAFDLEVFKLYENGCYQAGVQNRYTRALAYLESRPEYAKYDWRANRFAYGSPEYVAFEAGRKSDAFADLLHTSLYVK